MAWTYSGDPSSSELDKYRFLIGDTIQTEPILQDGEITFILSQYTSNNSRLYRLFTAAANLFNRDIRHSLGPESEDPSSRSAYFAKMADYYNKLDSGSGLSQPSYAHDKIFSKGMHDNV